MTHREYRTWQVWLEKQWNEPDRTDHYLMQIAGYVCHVLSKKTRINLGNFKIPFEVIEPAAVKPQTTKEEATRRAKSRWLPLFKGVVRMIKG